ncbi:MAG TPA: hypothetical protein PLP89_00700 [Synergistales bacterium]|jgi:hypothetical protein|nr:hypothetical protein [Synergistales bacterium]HRV71510.1 hypothetical protein [Thermovirgaceae bacterium]
MPEKILPVVPAGTSSNRKDNARIEKACRDFEAIMVAALMKETSAGKASRGTDGERNTFGALEETAWEMTAGAVSSRGEGFGLWRQLYESITKGTSGGEGHESDK